MGAIALDQSDFGQTLFPQRIAKACHQFKATGSATDNDDLGAAR
jgi:hypothetical protein